MASNVKSKIDIERAYQMWKSGDKIQNILDEFGCSRSIFNKWRNRAIVGPDGVKLVEAAEKMLTRLADAESGKAGGTSGAEKTTVIIENIFRRDACGQEN